MPHPSDWLTNSTELRPLRNLHEREEELEQAGYRVFDPADDNPYAMEDQDDIDHLRAA